MSNDDQYVIRTVDRAISVLDAVAQSEEPIALNVIAANTGLSLPTVFRLAHTLERQGLIMARKEDSLTKYVLGFRILQLSKALERQLDVITLARPHLGALRDRTGETASLALRDGDMVFFGAQIESQQALRQVATVGVPSPLYTACSGRVLLADDTDEQIEEYIDRTQFVPQPQFVPRNQPNPLVPTTGTQLWKQIRRIRELGFDEGTDAQGGVRLAVPVRDSAGRVRAVVHIAAPRERYNAKLGGFWVSAAKETARDISAQLGFADSSDPDCTPSLTGSVSDGRQE